MCLAKTRLTKLTFLGVVVTFHLTQGPMHSNVLLQSDAQEALC